MHHILKIKIMDTDFAARSKMDETFRFYRQQRETHTKILQSLKRRIYQIGTLRLLVIGGMFITLWLLRDEDWVLEMMMAGGCLFCFLLLVVYHSKLHNQRDFEEGLIRLFDNELKALDGDFSAFDGAPEQVDSQHAFSMDLDLFGDRSLYQMINRTVTKMGKEALIKRFLQPLTGKKEILMCQEGVREMAGLTDFRHHFYVTGEIASKEKQDTRFLLSTGNDRRISDHRISSILIWFVPAVWTLLLAGVSFGLIPPAYLIGYLVICFLFTTLPSKRIRNMYTSVSMTEKILKTYSKLMERVEQEHFDAVVLQNHQAILLGSVGQSPDDADHNAISSGVGQSPGKYHTASSAIKSLSRTIGALDQRFSFMGIILNLLYMRDTRQVMKLERWKEQYGDLLKSWFDALGFFDVFCSFGAFAFNHPDYIYPVLTDSYFGMEGKALGHPLIHRNQCICNDVCIPKSKFFLIITGANMAGKSTYLRTVGVNFLFSCMGLPVFAQSLAVYPARLVTSLRTADSLVSNESYFFDELKRLKMIIDRLDAGEQLLIILDEILKGTNSIDKQTGSFALIKQFIHKNTCGIVATHDLLLGSLAEQFPEHVQNKHFEADIEGDELTFTYQLREGIAQNMNATFLMEKMGIFVHELTRINTN